MHTGSATTGKPQPFLTLTTVMLSIMSQVHTRENLSLQSSLCCEILMWANTECKTVNSCSDLPANRSLSADSCTTGSAITLMLYSLASISLSHTAHRKVQSSYSGRGDLTEKGVPSLNPALSDRLRANEDPLARPGKAAGVRALLMAALTCLSASGPPAQQMY